ncbi:hypothetical protein D3C72_1369060 [compost metagenome]
MSPPGRDGLWTRRARTPILCTRKRAARAPRLDQPGFERWSGDRRRHGISYGRRNWRRRLGHGPGAERSGGGPRGRPAGARARGDREHPRTPGQRRLPAGDRAGLGHQRHRRSGRSGGLRSDSGGAAGPAYAGDAGRLCALCPARPAHRPVRQGHRARLAEADDRGAGRDDSDGHARGPVGAELRRRGGARPAQRRDPGLRG